MREINLNRQLLGLEDLEFGVGIVTQIRAGQNVDVTRINAGNLPFDETQSLFEWTQSINLEALGIMTTELQAIYDNLTTIGNVEDNLTVINTLEDNLVALQSLYTNISKLQNIDTNMSKLQNIDTNMSKLQNIDTNMSKLQAIYTDLTKLKSIYSNLTMLTAIYNNLTALNNINSKVIPNLTELLLVNDNAIQVAADKLTVATDKGIVAGYKDDVSAMKVAVESIYYTFDDRFLGVKTNDPTLDNDGNALIDGAMYFNTSSNALKVYSLDNTTWYTIPQIYLSGLLDVTLTSITTGDILTWNGTKWVNTRTPSFDSIKLNGGTGTAGTATWNNTELTYDLVLNDNVTLQVGQEEVVYCKNSTTTTIPNGKPVMAVGTNGNSGNILVALHDGTKASAKRIIGVTTQAILPSNNANPYGFVTRNGKVRGLNTTGSEYGETWLDGDILYVKATGALTKVEPLDTALKMPIAFVIHAHSNGTLYVRTTGIDENHDRDFINDLVNIHSKTAKTTLVDADEIMIADSASTWSLKKITWANIKTALGSLFVGKVTSTNNSLPRFNGTTGDIKDSLVQVGDTGNMLIPGSATIKGQIAQQVDGISNILIRNIAGYNRIDSYNNPITNTYPLSINASRYIFLVADIIKMELDASGALFVPYVYSNTTASAANMFIDSTGKFFRSTSSKKYKTDIETIDKSYIDTFFDNARPIYYKSLSTNDNQNWGYWGFIAEEIAEFDKRLVHWRFDTKDVEVEKERIIPAIEEQKDDDGNVIQEAKNETIEKYTEIEKVNDESKPMIAEGVMYERITVLLTAKLQEQKEVIDNLIKRIETLEEVK